MSRRIEYYLAGVIGSITGQWLFGWDGSSAGIIVCPILFIPVGMAMEALARYHNEEEG